MTLAEFLLARIAEDQMAAECASQPSLSGIAPWTCEPTGDPGQSIVWNGVGQAVASHAYHWQGQHVATWDPARVLIECEAKRRMVKRAAGLAEHYEPSDPDQWEPLQYAAQESGENLGRWLLATIALPYAGHPDYREEWRP